MGGCVATAGRLGAVCCGLGALRRSVS